MVKAGEALSALRNSLTAVGIPDAGFEVDLLVRHVTGKNRFMLEELKESEWEQLRGLVERRVQRQPLQYLLGTWPFLDLKLAVGPGVLIPRPETEEVCLAACALLEGKRAPQALDLCAGSGALALGIAKQLPQAQVTAVEWDKDAFVYLEKNIAAFSGEYGNPPTAVKADALTYYEELPNESLDLIVSNPPYVTEDEYASLAPELYHEPKQALVALENGLLFYRVIAQKYYPLLKPGGFLVFEIGAGQGERVNDILEKNMYCDIRIRQDMCGNSRIAVGMRQG